ncbi:hypothetical protein N7532_010031 [Penicillium argentinense]|uniref:Uncharacterized protein n=1 Tax=Penicillium argentinense TaxID=1131581 RepID=A0A9W9JXM5_9EURO|nr:uncharacterized protein N7532_010031 [Penicillium argentinense]KAJ5085260.1 hypothetical protein N7532_010031 [Penicillium argentinense]
MIYTLETVLMRQHECNNNGIFTPEKLEKPSMSCYWRTIISKPHPIYAKDFRQHTSFQKSEHPTDVPVFQLTEARQLATSYTQPMDKLTNNICADAKYFGVIACGAGFCDEGTAWAVASSCNNILIGDYCEAADAKGLEPLQKAGAGAMASLKMCNIADRVSDCQFDNLAAYMIQCRVLGYFRDHSRSRLPDVIYDSRMIRLCAHRPIDVAPSTV